MSGCRLCICPKVQPAISIERLVVIVFILKCVPALAIARLDWAADELTRQITRRRQSGSEAVLPKGGLLLVPRRSPYRRPRLSRRTAGTENAYQFTTGTSVAAASSRRARDAHGQTTGFDMIGTAHKWTNAL